VYPLNKGTQDITQTLFVRVLWNTHSQVMEFPPASMLWAEASADIVEKGASKLGDQFASKYIKIGKLPIGMHTFLITVDPDNQQKELDEQNNTYQHIVTIGQDANQTPISREDRVKQQPVTPQSFDAKLTARMKGTILLQVESKGEAWYVHDGKRYYLGDGNQAYQIMRFLSLGITNENLRKIAVGELE